MDTSAETSDFTATLERRLATLTPQLKRELSRFLAEAIRLKAARLTFEAEFDCNTTPIMAEAYAADGQVLEFNGQNEILSHSPFYSLEMHDLTDWGNEAIARDFYIITKWFADIWVNVGGQNLPIKATLYSYSYEDVEQFDLQTGKW